MKTYIFIFLLIYISCSNNQIVRKSPEPITNYTFSSDSIYLFFLGGFSKDTIIINYHDKIIVRQNVTTDESLGMAFIEVLPTISIDTITVTKVGKYSSLKITIEDIESKFIGIWTDYKNSELRYRCNEKAFRFE